MSVQRDFSTRFFLESSDIIQKKDHINPTSRSRDIISQPEAFHGFKAISALQKAFA
jgi:hypothetical protein